MTNENKEAPVDPMDVDGAIVEVDDESSVGDAGSQGDSSLAKSETRVVHAFRKLLMLLLAFTAIAVSLTAYFRTRSEEINDFEDAFTGHATKVSVFLGVFWITTLKYMPTRKNRCSHAVLFVSDYGHLRGRGNRKEDRYYSPLTRLD